MNAEERYSRQRDIVPIDKLKDKKVSVIGVGAVGRNVALQLASMGVNNLHLIDFDKVEESNIASQGYLEGDLGKYKVDATAAHCQLINGTIKVKVENNRFKGTTRPGRIVFCCVDDIEARKRIFSRIRNEVDLFIDGRMHAEAFRVLAAFDSESKSYYYNHTLFPAEEADQGSCTAKSTIYCASGLACFEAQILAKWLRDMPIQKDVLVNLLSNEIEVLKE